MTTNHIYQPAPLDGAKNNEDLYALALWYIYGILGFDTDGDAAPGPVIAGMGPKGFAQLVIDSAREHANCYEDLLMRDPEEYL